MALDPLSLFSAYVLDEWPLCLYTVNRFEIFLQQLVENCRLPASIGQVHMCYSAMNNRCIMAVQRCAPVFTHIAMLAGILVYFKEICNYGRGDRKFQV